MPSIFTFSQEQVAEVLSQIDDKHRHLIEEVQFAMEESSFLATTSTSLKALPTNPTEFINVAECFVRKLIKVFFLFLLGLLTCTGFVDRFVI